MPECLVVASNEGLGNRLRVLLSGLALAELTGREFTMLWPRSRACAASFAELFANKWNVVEASAHQVEALPLFGGHRGARMPDFAKPHGQVLAFRGVDWLVPRDTRWRTRLLRNGPLRPVLPLEVSVMKRAVELACELNPSEAVATRIARFREQYFRSTMIGVHLRRGDFSEHRPDVAGNTHIAIAQVDRFLSQAPEAGVLLCTDDGTTPLSEGVHSVFTARYGNRVAATVPRSLDRAQPVAAEDAVVDLLLLRETHYFVGTKGSSFSELAAFGRAIPTVLLGAARPRDRWMRYTGIEAALIATGWLRFGRVMPATYALRRLREEGTRPKW